MSESSVDGEAVKHVAELARIELDDEDVAEFADQFDEILSYFDALDEVPAVESETELVNVMRPDEVESSLSQEDALANAEETEDGYFKGPTVS